MNKDDFDMKLYDKNTLRRFTMFAIGETFEDAIAQARITSDIEKAIRLQQLLQSLVSDRAVIIFGFDAFVDKDSNHWNA